MIGERISAGVRTRRAVFVVVLVVGLVAVGGLVPSASARPEAAGPGHTATPVPGNPSAPRTVHSKLFAKLYGVDALSSISTTSLLQLLYSNGSSRLVLYNAAKNSSRDIERFVPGGVDMSLIGIASAGGVFFLSWENALTGQEVWQEVTLTGVISTVTPPVGTSPEWAFAYGNATALFAAYGKFLVQIDPLTLALVANYSHELPKNVSVTAVLPGPGILYLAGGRIVASGGEDAYFGVLNLTTKKVTTVSKAIPYPANLDAGFEALIAKGPYVYVGGYLAATNSTGAFSIAQGYFYRFDPATHAFKNLSSLLPVPQWGVFALEPWGTTVAMSLSGYEVAVPAGLTGLAGGIYTLSSSGRSLVNQTSIFPAHYLAFIYAVTDASDGWYFSGGFSSTPSVGVAEVVAVKT